MNERIRVGDLVQHFKREITEDKTKYLYKVIAFARHSETDEKLVVYQALYADPDKGINYGVYVRPYDMFMSEVDHVKYPQIHQMYRFEKLENQE